MGLKVGPLGEALPAHLTLIRFLSRVDSAVDVEVCATTEALPAALASVGLLSGVNGQVGIQV